jgi:hypothetical protein
MIDLTTPDPANTGEIFLYQTEDGETRIEVRIVNETVWLSLNQMAELFQRDKSVVSKHIANVFHEGELDENSVVAKFATTAADGKTYQVSYFNLDVIISVGYRVKSHRGTQFRIWSTQRVRDFIVKGFVLDDVRFKQAGSLNYFDELLARIRDIRSSEKVFWRKVLDIYATSIDYDPQIDLSQEFFRVVQNKMHWAAHGHTAAEIIKERANATMPNMGLTTYAGSKPTLADAKVAKNYLTEQEIDTLNRLVTIYLEFAELQAQQQRVMYMKDWMKKLDDFLRISDREVLINAGRISAKQAEQHAAAEYEQFKKTLAKSKVDDDFEKTLKKLDSAEAKIKSARKR